jgi:L-threonylcarbamoyladenylate synthase
VSEIVEVTDGLENGVRAAASALDRGELAVFPTDTVYGVAARPDVPGATERIFEAKRRPRGLTLPVLAATIEDAETVAALDDRARRLADRFWPGGLTIVLSRTARSRGWDLGDQRETVGVRLPSNDIALALLQRTGPLAVTSANRSGERTPKDCDGIRAVLGDVVAIYLCSVTVSGDVPSTVVDLTGAEPRIVRTGAVPPAAVLEALR